jgi:hypothetical protein
MYASYGLGNGTVSAVVIDNAIWGRNAIWGSDEIWGSTTTSDTSPDVVFEHPLDGITQ